MPKKLNPFWKFAIVLAMGFTSGLPLALTGSTLKAWLTSSGLDLTTIGFFSWLSFPYSLKFLWSPLADRYTIPMFGRRRGWLLLTQAALIIALLALGSTNPAASITPVAILAL